VVGFKGCYQCTGGGEREACPKTRKNNAKRSRTQYFRRIRRGNTDQPGTIEDVSKKVPTTCKGVGSTGSPKKLPPKTRLGQVEKSPAAPEQIRKTEKEVNKI